jgi:hypothetical protein
VRVSAALICPRSGSSNDFCGHGDELTSWATISLPIRLKILSVNILQLSNEHKNGLQHSVNKKLGGPKSQHGRI